MYFRRPKGNNYITIYLNSHQIYSTQYFKVIFYANNDRQNRNQGAVGLDNIQLFVPNGSSADAASQPIC